MMLPMVLLAAFSTERNCAEHRVAGGLVDYVLCTHLADKDTVKIEIDAKTSGWVGVGVGEPTSGGMPGADIAIVTEQSGVLDMHAVGKGVPVEDCVQGGWVLESKTFQNDWTKIVLLKSVKTQGDTTQDRDVPPGGNLILLAYGASQGLSYHASVRTITSHIFYNETTQHEESSVASGHVDVLMPNWTVPQAATTYACASFDLETHLPTATKRHVTRFEPVIKTGRGYQVHHVLLFACSSTSPTFETYGEVKADRESCRLGFECRRFMKWGWAVGGRSLILPEGVGVPFGPGAADTKLILEFHYDNPQGFTGGVDDSGVRLHFSEELQNEEAGFLNVGDPFVQYEGDIVPGVEKTVKFECGPDCTEKYTGPIDVLGAWIHMHKIGSRGTLEIHRNGGFNTTVASVDYWDNDMQRFVALQHQGQSIHPGDVIRTTCQFYHTQAHAVSFGLATDDEMCMAFILVTPFSRTPGTACGQLGSTLMCGSAYLDSTRWLVNDVTPLAPRWGECTAQIANPPPESSSTAIVIWWLLPVVMLFGVGL